LVLLCDQHRQPGGLHGGGGRAGEQGQLNQLLHPHRLLDSGEASMALLQLNLLIAAACSTANGPRYCNLAMFFAAVRRPRHRLCCDPVLRGQLDAAVAAVELETRQQQHTTTSTPCLFRESARIRAAALACCP
jgi:hypothetical protein